jgi:hypothetical protein
MPASRPAARLGAPTTLTNPVSDLVRFLPAEMRAKYPAETYQIREAQAAGGLLDTEGQIGEHLYDDWNSQLVNTGSASPRFGFRSKEGSTLSGSGSLSGDALNASYRFASFDGDSLAFALTATARESGSGASASGNLSLTLASGKGTRTRDDDIASLPRLLEPGKGLVSSACEDHMGAYVLWERRELETKVSEAMREVR